MEWIGKRIRKQRRRLGLTQGELATKASISKPYLSLIETGRTRNPPSDKKLESLGHALGLAPDLLLIHARLWRTPPEVRLILEQMIAGREVDGPVDQLMREILTPPDAGQRDAATSLKKNPRKKTDPDAGMEPMPGSAPVSDVAPTLKPTK